MAHRDRSTAKQSKDPVIVERKRLYKTGQWKAVRKQILQRDPVCVLCNAAASNQVDHIMHTDNNALFFNPSNLRGTCATCNNKRGARDRGRKAWVQAGNTKHADDARHVDRIANLMSKLRGGTGGAGGIG
ncbi:HNH endonuclease signature motif containing protein [Celeribacter marinus]|uniref:HNH endonuclease signature motif containing protein n=1 Tax=Celeribacter marinus TaxID=1397108 RepID=UPI003171D05D